jgi:hypothetical protein
MSVSGVSSSAQTTGTDSTDVARFSTCWRTWSNLVVKRLSAVRIPPFGPKLYLRTPSHQLPLLTHLDCMHSLLHDLVVVDRVANVDVGSEGKMSNGGVEIEDVGRLLLRVEVRVDALHERRLAAACHTDYDDGYGGVIPWKSGSRKGGVCLALALGARWNGRSVS